MQRDAKLQGENAPIRCAPIRCFFISRNPKNSRIYVSTILGITLEQPVATWKPNRNNELRGVLLSVLKPLGQFQVRSRGSFFGWKKLAKIDCKIPLGQKKTSKFFQQCIPPPGSSWICEILGDVKLGNQHVRLEAMKSQGDLSHLVKHDITQDQPSICLCTASSSITLLGQPDFVQAQIWSWQRRSWNLIHLSLSHICPTR